MAFILFNFSVIAASNVRTSAIKWNKCCDSC